jgi:hypothetical protein
VLFGVSGLPLGHGLGQRLRLPSRFGVARLLLGGALGLIRVVRFSGSALLACHLELPCRFRAPFHFRFLHSLNCRAPRGLGLSFALRASRGFSLDCCAPRRFGLNGRASRGFRLLLVGDRILGGGAAFLSRVLRLLTVAVEFFGGGGPACFLGLQCILGAFQRFGAARGFELANDLEVFCGLCRCVGGGAVGAGCAADAGGLSAGAAACDGGGDSTGLLRRPRMS